MYTAVPVSYPGRESGVFPQTSNPNQGGYSNA